MNVFKCSKIILAKCLLITIYHEAQNKFQINILAPKGQFEKVWHSAKIVYRTQGHLEVTEKGS